MEYVYAALLVHNSGKPVTEEAIVSVLKAAGASADATRAKALVAALEGVNIKDVLAKAAAAPVMAAAPAAAAPAAGGDAKKKDEKKEEDKGKAEESGIEGLSALFG
ncbi:MAG: 50S ribosomal protein P1 [Euryarchaeota archaeon]|nr:50S ribosomal protein P1 [Euryarchaeota archaeon]